MIKSEADAFVLHLNKQASEGYKLAVQNWLLNADQRRSYGLPPAPFPVVPLAWRVVEVDPQGNVIHEDNFSVVEGPGLAAEPAFTWGDFGVIHTPEKAHIGPTPFSFGGAKQ